MSNTITHDSILYNFVTAKDRVLVVNDELLAFVDGIIVTSLNIHYGHTAHYVNAA